MKNNNKFLLIPTFIFIVIFTIIPLFTTLSDSLSKNDSISTENFKYLFEDKIFKQAVGNTIWIGIIATFSSVLISFILAYMISTIPGKRFKNVISSGFFFQYFVSIYALSLSIFFMFGQDVNLINKIFGTSVRWLSDSDGSTSIFTLSIILVWRLSSFNIVLFMASFGKINKQMLSNGKIDRLKMHEKLFHIYIPEMKSVIKLVLYSTIMSSILFHSSVFFGNPGNLNNAYTSNGLTLISYIIGKQASFQLDLASSATIFVIVMMISIVLSIFIIQKIIIKITEWRREWWQRI